MERVARIVAAVVREALRERGLIHVQVLRRQGPGLALLLSWLESEGIPSSVVDHPPPAREALIADPGAKEDIILEGPLAGADILPLGDLWGSLLAAGDLSAPLTPLERGLRDAFEQGLGLAALEAYLGKDEADRTWERLLRAAPLLRPPVVPKLTEWTPGIDPGP